MLKNVEYWLVENDLSQNREYTTCLNRKGETRLVPINKTSYGPFSSVSDATAFLHQYGIDEFDYAIETVLQYG